MPQISIIVPVYKVEQYLHKCLDSILAQTFTDWECILIDDGSPDSSGAICDEYAQQDSRFRVIHQENKGSAGARNTGLQMAQGIYLICVDSDDWVEPDYLECLYNEAKRTGADVVGCNLVREYEGKPVEERRTLPPESLECIRGLLERKIRGWLHIKFLRRSLVVEHKISFVEGLDLWEDMLFCTKFFFFTNKISNVDKILYHYRYNATSITSTVSEKQLEQVVGNMQEIESFLRQQNLFSTLQNEIELSKARIKSYYVIFSANREIRKKYYSLYQEYDSELSQLPYSVFSRIYLFCYLHKFYKICDFLFFLKYRK